MCKYYVQTEGTKQTVVMVILQMVQLKNCSLSCSYIFTFTTSPITCWGQGDMWWVGRLVINNKCQEITASVVGYNCSTQILNSLFLQYQYLLFLISYFCSVFNKQQHIQILQSKSLLQVKRTEASRRRWVGMLFSFPVLFSNPCYQCYCLFLLAFTLQSAQSV